MDLFEKCATPPLALQMKDAGFDAFYRVLQSACDTEVVVDGRRLIMLGSNNYLGLAVDPRVKNAAAEALSTWGAGTAGSRCLNGTTDLHSDLEKRIARFYRRDAALYYTSGYMANLGTISALAQRGDFVVVDKRAHASIVDGAKLSYAEVKRFRHNDAGDLDRILESCGDSGGKLVAVDGVYSMDGDIAPLPRIVEVCRKRGARLLVDDAHALGVLGRTGRGTAEHFGVEDQVDLIVGTTSKALPGLGGFVVAEQQVIEYLRYGATNRPFIFATAAPAHVVASVRAGLELIDREPALRNRLWTLTRRMLHALQGMGFDTGASRTPIIPITVGTLERTFEMWRKLSEEGIFVNMVLPPAVPNSGCLIRMTLTASHTDEQIDRVLDALERVGAELGIIPGRSEPPKIREVG
ncbi:MAG TPA: pyridoxal phosphate-dependent aminotransferase family protein [Anaeromyxobacter sp.]